VLGSSVPGAVVPAGKKGVCTLEAHGPAGDRTVILQCPIKNTVPLAREGKRCGRRERESRRGGRREQSLRDRHQNPPRVVMVEGILVFWKAALFAGRRRNEGLGRSAGRSGYLPAAGGAPMTADVRRAPRRGTPSACATTRMHRPQAREIVACEHGTRPSLGPSTRARRSSLCSAGESPGGGAPSETSRSGKPSQEGGTGTGASESGRSAARRASPLPQGRGRDAMKKRKEIEVSVPARAE
jgi:hypothetical protein